MQVYIYLSAFLTITFCILTHSKDSVYFASRGLQLWFYNMIPSLLPFMILSGTMIRMNLTESFTAFAYPVIKPIYRISKNVCYVMLMGFFCGFPMGAKCIADLYANGRITRHEANFLLAFCNNIGPVYFISFALPLIGIKQPCIPLIGMYGIPLLYGFLLRYMFWGNKISVSGIENNHASHPLDDQGFRVRKHNKSIPFGEALDSALVASLQSMSILGGYMILFNLLMMLPKLYLPAYYPFFAPLLEISGGLSDIGEKFPVYSLLALSFGGISCIAQTYTCIRDTDLKLWHYLKHKVILTTLTAAYYLLCLRFFRLL